MSKKEDGKLLIFINPASGTKLARKMFRSILVPLLDQHELSYEVIETEYAGHAQDFVESCQDLKSRYSSIVIVSGDGLIHEVYNGLAARSDWHQVADIPVGLVPGGSGNALNCSLLRQLQQPLDGINNLGASWAARNVAVGAAEDKTIPLDLMEVELQSGRKIMSFFGVTIGLVADVDIGKVHLYLARTLHFSFQAPRPSDAWDICELTSGSFGGCWCPKAIMYAFLICPWLVIRRPANPLPCPVKKEN